jgi:hypothetical protein
MSAQVALAALANIPVEPNATAPSAQQNHGIII